MVANVEQAPSITPYTHPLHQQNFAFKQYQMAIISLIRSMVPPIRSILQWMLMRTRDMKLVIPVRSRQSQGNKLFSMPLVTTMHQKLYSVFVPMVTLVMLPRWRL